jgi:hypothetical protein
MCAGDALSEAATIMIGSVEFGGFERGRPNLRMLA